MPAGTWAFIHESTIYEYLMIRSDEGILRVKQVFEKGNVLFKRRWVNVVEMRDILNTRFPDISGIRFKGQEYERPAEVKFVTSSFDYHLHRRYARVFAEFKNHRGCIIVLRHDHLPQSLIEQYPNVDIYEIDETDYIAFIRENFIRLLNRQMRLHTYKRIWLMQQSKNFWYENSEVAPAAITGRWCPSDNLNGFDLALNDMVVFVRHSGKSYQNVAKYWNRAKEIIPGWILEDIFVGRVIFPILSRYEYCQKHHYHIDAPLWYDETAAATRDTRVRARTVKWPKVFEFEPVINLKGLGLSLRQLQALIPDFVTAVLQVFATHVSRPIEIETYLALIEYLAQYENIRAKSDG